MKICCNFMYCLYNKDSKCILDAIGINSLGMCEQCMIVLLDEELIENEKERQLLELESRLTIQ